jgi:hypothetical protein
MATLTDFSCGFGKADSATLAAFLLHLCKASPATTETEKRNTFNQKEKRKMCKTDSDWSDSKQKIVKSGKRKLEDDYYQH